MVNKNALEVGKLEMNQALLLVEITLANKEDSGELKKAQVREHWDTFNRCKKTIIDAYDELSKKVLETEMTEEEGEKMVKDKMNVLLPTLKELSDLSRAIGLE